MFYLALLPFFCKDKKEEKEGTEHVSPLFQNTTHAPGRGILNIQGHQVYLPSIPYRLVYLSCIVSKGGSMQTTVDNELHLTGELNGFQPSKLYDNESAEPIQAIVSKNPLSSEKSHTRKVTTSGCTTRELLRHTN